ncbi:hypothetical protein [Desulforamulus aeronauticus]|uniref:Pentapeptide MXKDX repeat protein n=1 Tax=Desulforamulus aeronauticus DSM 10349 TaxID=1121421 RepID=A0A1M6X5A5_9FIRM|nr:hypothetical protein [Desulforamulus aeronauticus]SHL01118.1 hypothetical protein SAMN02745123_03906 [Desulforamulus aeronauticus DSM 10349]
MLSKKKLITGVTTLVLGISAVGAAYALPMTSTPMQSLAESPKATITIKQSADTTDTAKTADETKQNTAGPMADVNSKTMPAGQAMNQQTMGSQMQGQMNQNHQQMTQNHEQMQQNHQQMNQSHQSMQQNHQAMSGSTMSGQPMGNGHMGF